MSNWCRGCGAELRGRDRGYLKCWLCRRPSKGEADAQRRLNTIGVDPDTIARNLAAMRGQTTTSQEDQCKPK